jgi:short-subunit dehydrogenase
LVEQSDESHIVSTASTAGLIPIPELGIGPYTASKYAIVGISEKLRGEVDGNGIGVSVLCPGGVRTNLMTSERNRPTELGGTGKASENILAGGKDPLEVGRLVLAGVKANQAYMFTDLTIEDAVEARFKAIKAGFAATRELLEKGV